MPSERSAQAGSRLLPAAEGGFLSGVNLPWLDYGCDFGANAWQPNGGLARSDRRERLRGVLARLQDAGIRLVRWFWLCDGRSGLRAGDDPLGLDEHVIADLDTSLDLLGQHDVQVMPVLLDFLWFRRRKTLNGVSMGGRGRMIAESSRAVLIERVFEPLLARFGASDVVFAWDVMNEPEWATRGAGGRKRASTVDAATMKGFLRDLVSCAHQATRHPVTVGLASAKGLPLVRDLELDFYQVHWYDSVGLECRPDRPVGPLCLDRPIMLGEFPTRGSAFAPAALLESARRAGYVGALAWSVLAEDDATDGEVALAVDPDRGGLDRGPDAAARHEAEAGRGLAGDLRREREAGVQDDTDPIRERE